MDIPRHHGSRSVNMSRVDDLQKRIDDTRPKIYSVALSGPVEMEVHRLQLDVLELQFEMYQMISSFAKKTTGEISN